MSTACNDAVQEIICKTLLVSFSPWISLLINGMHIKHQEVQSSKVGLLRWCRSFCEKDLRLNNFVIIRAFHTPFRHGNNFVTETKRRKGEGDQKRINTDEQTTTTNERPRSDFRIFLISFFSQKKDTMARFLTKSALVLALANTSKIVSSFSPIPLSKMHSHSLTSLHGSSESSITEAQNPTKSLQYIDGIQALSSQYDTFLLDMWGVMHDGTNCYEGVIDTIQQLKQQKKKMIILSNSSKRVSKSKKMLKKLGFEEDDFDQIITSGDVSYRMLSGDETLQCSTWGILQDLIERKQNKVFVFGSGDGDEEYIKESGWELASVEEADLIVARGTFTINNGDGSPVSKKDDEGNYFEVLKKSLEIAASRNVPMLVTNPDKVRPDKGLPPMPGAIGDAYEDVLGGGSGATDLVKRIGKPYSEVYELALGSVGDSDLRTSRTVMVGDALETDVTGGTWAGCSTAWIVNDGIHSPAVKEAGSEFEFGTKQVLNDFNDKKGYTDTDRLCPTYVSKHFRW